MTHFRLVPLGLLCLLALNIAIAAGKLTDGIYFSPLDNYTVPVPKWRGLRIRDRNDTGFAMPNLFLNVSPQATIAHEEFIESGDGRFYFAVVNVPEAHAFLRDAQKGKQADSVSALLIFHNKGFMYMLRSEMKSLFNSTLNPSSLSPRTSNPHGRICF